MYIKGSSSLRTMREAATSDYWSSQLFMNMFSWDDFMADLWTLGIYTIFFWKGEHAIHQAGASPGSSFLFFSFGMLPRDAAICERKYVSPSVRRLLLSRRRAMMGNIYMRRRTTGKLIPINNTGHQQTRRNAAMRNEAESVVWRIREDYNSRKEPTTPNGRDKQRAVTVMEAEIM